jgi:methionyl aminopeptidase
MAFIVARIGRSGVDRERQIKTVLDLCSGDGPRSIPMSVEIAGPREMESLRRAGEAAAATLAYVGDRLRAGIATLEIDRWVREHTTSLGGRPSQLGYKGFPAAVCTSRNQVVCHGIPRRDEVLQPGDIVNVDVTTDKDGFHGDT